MSDEQSAHDWATCGNGRHQRWPTSFTGAALGVLATASGTYLGVSSRLDGDGAFMVFAALTYSTAVPVGIFVF